MKTDLTLAAELFAASFLELCPEVNFSSIRVGKLGFYIDYTLPFQIKDDFLRLIEERMREKIRNHIYAGIFEMSTKNVIECLKELKQYQLAKSIDRSYPSYLVIKIGNYLGIVDEEFEIDFSRLGALFLQVRGSSIFGVSFETKDALKEYKKLLKDKTLKNHIEIGKEEALFEMEESEIYWLPKGLEFRKKIESRIVQFLIDKGFCEVDFTGNIVWYKDRGLKKIFTTLEEEEDTYNECGLKDQSLQKIVYVTTSSLQLFEDFGKIMPLIFESQRGKLVCRDFYKIPWDIIWQEGDGVKISIDRIAAMLVEKRDFLVC
jgi:hypothetical protein